MTEEGERKLDEPAIKRRRKVLSCVECKRRKIGCDRNNPCNKCQQFGRECRYFEQPLDVADTPDTTKPSNGKINVNRLSVRGRILDYVEERKTKSTESSPKTVTSPINETSPDLSVTTLKNSNAYLVSEDINSIVSRFVNGASVIGINPISSPDDKINFFNFESLSVDPSKYEINHGPFTWHAFIKMDPAMAYLSSFLAAKSKELSDYSAFSENAQSFTHAPFQVLQRLKLSSKQFSDRQINKSAIPLGLNFVPDDEVGDLRDKIEKILPDKTIVWIHVSRLFKFLYPFVPFIDEESFVDSLESIIGPSDGPYEKITVKISHALDYSTLGILLLILRLSYLSLISNDDEFNSMVLNNAPVCEDCKFTQEELVNLNKILRIEIGIESTFLASDCFWKFGIYQKSCLPIMQLALMLRVYFFVCPEDPDGPDRNKFQICTGLLVQIAYSIGLNREPTKLGLTDVKTNNIRRKIWHELVYLDLNQGAFYGTPTSIRPQFCDTKFPFYEEGNSNMKATFFDRLLLDCNTVVQGLNKVLRTTLDSVMQLEDISMTEVVLNINKLEVYISKHIAIDLKVFVDGFNETDDTYTFKDKLLIGYYIQNKLSLVAVYYHIFLFYEKRDEMDFAYFYLKKAACILIEDMLPSCFEILNHFHYWFLYSGSLFTNPLIAASWHNANGFMFAILIRVQFTLRNLRRTLDSDSEELKLWERLFTTFIATSEEFCIEI
ncbi:hypothetical protein G210_0908 [Candida maltosa Xu316]|uniref:Zn(2)-C6 fungal-type domain-containing protein n=1 Tax=Candida maltosa (strain Xu316) TaxID=1245528 RepID=M3HM40_CANMX|nr:hypothetical protein G210_0908 [Candida maltosa Xu316]